MKNFLASDISYLPTCSFIHCSLGWTAPWNTCPWIFKMQSAILKGIISCNLLKKENYFPRVFLVVPSSFCSSNEVTMYFLYRILSSQPFRTNNIEFFILTLSCNIIINFCLDTFFFFNIQFSSYNFICISSGLTLRQDDAEGLLLDAIVGPMPSRSSHRKGRWGGTQPQRN